ncbi:MAG: hypothetical protein L0H63_11955 [Nitrococcus sp.]|nr:hypothetical protein [Nitrococcus sp.]
MRRTYDPALVGVASPVDVPVAEVADVIGKVRVAEHTALLGKPAEHLGDAMELASPITDVASAVAAELPLPLDQQLRNARKTLCLVGMLAGALTGNVQVFAACLKLYVRDKAVDLVKKKVHEAVFNSSAA